jgi:lipopolysaccharide cholinephosphotransferase
MPRIYICGIICASVLGILLLITIAVLVISYAQTFRGMVHVGGTYTIDGTTHTLTPLARTPSGKYPIIRDELASTLKALYIDFERVCNAHRVSMWAAYGTLLGCIRHAGFVPWDDDMDVQIMKADLCVLASGPFRSDMSRVGLVFKTSLMMPSVLRVTRATGHEFIDVFIMDGGHNRIYACGNPVGEMCSKAWDSPPRYYTQQQIFPLRRAPFENITMWIPHRPRDILNSEFGGNVLNEYQCTHMHVVCVYLERMFVSEWDPGEYQDTKQRLS